MSKPLIVSVVQDIGRKRELAARIFAHSKAGDSAVPPEFVRGYLKALYEIEETIRREASHVEEEAQEAAS